MTLSVWNWHFNQMSGDLGREIQNLQQYWFQFQFKIWVWTAFVFVFVFSISFAFVLLPPRRWWQHVLCPGSHYNSVKLKHKRRELILISIRHKRSRLYFICTFEYIIVHTYSYKYKFKYKRRELTLIYRVGDFIYSVLMNTNSLFNQLLQNWAFSYTWRKEEEEGGDWWWYC